MDQTQQTQQPQMSLDEVRTQLKMLEEKVRQLAPLPQDKVTQLKQQVDQKVKEDLAGLWDPNKAVQTKNIFLANAVAQMDNPDSPFRQLMTALLPKQNMEFAEIRKAQQEALRIKAATENLITDSELKRALAAKTLQELQELKRSGELDERKLRIAETAAILNYYETAMKVWATYYQMLGSSIGLMSKQYTDALEALSKVATAASGKDVPKAVREQLEKVTTELSKKLGFPPLLKSSTFLGLFGTEYGAPSKEYVEMWETPKSGPKLPWIGLPEGAYVPGQGVFPSRFLEALQKVPGGGNPQEMLQKTKEFVELYERVREQHPMGR